MAKLIVSLAILSASITLYTWYTYMLRSLPGGGPQSLITDICYLYSLPPNASIESVYTFNHEIRLSPGELETVIAAAPVCGSLERRGSLYIYLLPISSRQQGIVLRGRVTLRLVRVEDGVVVENPGP